MIQFGDPRLPPRFWDKVIPEPNTGCWLWLGATRGGRSSYGAFNAVPSRTGHKIVASHRLTFGIENKLIDGLVIDHRCNVQICCNPLHLRQVTERENILRGASQSAVSAAKNTCAHGHPLHGDNIAPSSKPGRRICVACNHSNTRLHAGRKPGMWVRHVGDGAWHIAIEIVRGGSVMTACRGQWPWTDEYSITKSPDVHCGECLRNAEAKR